MPLSLYRRHSQKCPHAKKEGYMKCSCPIWCYGVMNGRETRKALKLRDMNRAVRLVERWEADPKSAAPAITVKEAVVKYLRSCERANLKQSTIISYRKTLDHFAAVAPAQMEDLSLDVFTEYCASREIKPTTRGKELEHLRTFGEFALGHKWIPENFARRIKAPNDPQVPTLPFSDEEVEKILDACDRMNDGNPNTIKRTRALARARCLVMLYSGFRISDTIKLERSNVDLETGEVLVRAMKTEMPLYVTLGAPAIEALRALPRESPYFFWNGRSKLSSAIGAARLSTQRILATAGVKGHPHRFRDTFAVSLLLAGEDIRTVQLLLGHTSIRTTEKHYAPWVKGFQKILNAATSKLRFGL